MKLALLPLFALLALPAPAQSVQHVLDVDMSTALNLGLSLSSGEPTYNVYDADWTADGRLVFAVARRFQTTKWFDDSLFIGIHDPQTGASTLLGSFTGIGWRFDHVSLVVPDRYYDVEGTGSSDGTTPIHDMNKVYVALGAEAPVYTSWNKNTSTYTHRVRVVRLFNVSFTSPAPKLGLTQPTNLLGSPVPLGAEGPFPELCVRGDAKDYAVDMVFVDPHSITPGGGQLMLVTTYDKGASLGKACFISGPDSPACTDPTHPLNNSLFSRPVMGYDDQGKGTRLLAVSDVNTKVVRLLSAAGNSLAFKQVVATFSQAQGHFEPRIAVRKGQANVTYLVGNPGSGGTRPLDWFSSSTLGGYVQHARITSSAHSAGDIEVRGNDAFIVVRQAPDQGVSTSVVMAYDMNRTNPLALPSGVRVDDEYTESNLRVVSALTPEYAQQALVKSAVFRFVHKVQPGDSNHSGLMRDDF